MNSLVLLSLAFLASALAFNPAPVSVRVSVARAALADNIFGLDLFDKKQNDYGARKGKNLKLGQITSKSYVPSGLSAAEYDKLRKAERTKKENNYDQRTKVAGKFQDFTKWYAQRGTDLGGKWLKDVTLGHTMAKTKYDWSGKKDETKKFESTNVNKFAASFAKPAAKKTK